MGYKAVPHRPAGRSRLDGRIKHLSLFSGIGGFDLGFERAGIESVGQVEKDPFCQKVLERHWPTIPRWEDIANVRGDDLPDFDVLSGGFPCQDISVAGNRAGLAGDRSGLWFEFARIIAETSPLWVVIENVPGLLSSNKGRDLGTIIGFLAEHGYGFAWRVLDAQWFGVPQRRRRIFIVGHLGGSGAAEVLAIAEGSIRDTPSREKSRTVASALTREGSGLGGGGADDNSAQANHLIPVGWTETRQESWSASDPMGTSDTGSAGTRHLSHLVTPFTQNQRDEIRIIDEAGGAEISTALSHKQGSKQATYLAFQSNAGNRLHKEVHDDQSPPVRVGSGPGAANPPAVAGIDLLNQTETGDVHVPLRTARGHGAPAVMRTNMVRRLTPTECARLQGFPDDWNDWLSDTQRYRQYGNAVCVNVAEWIGSRLASRVSSG